jgi:Relaxase/Mobilisation nuclease domain
MQKRTVDLRAHPLLDVASYGRSGPGGARSLSMADIAYVRRTVSRAPEVMIKVSGGARSLRGVRAHFDYIGREGKGAIETDEGIRIQEKGFENALVEDWDLDLDLQRRHNERAIAAGRKPPKLVHNLVFSMPNGTPPDKLQRAVRVFARENFGFQHRYAMALHTDQGHPHVHMVVRAMSEEGARLNIRKATLREWRSDFAEHLREQGVAANATERAVRGEIKSRKTDGIHRAMMRGDSFHHRNRVAAAAKTLAKDGPADAPGSERMVNTRKAVVTGWKAVAKMLDGQGHGELAARVTRFVDRMPPPRTEQEALAVRIKERSRSASDQHPALTR